MIKIIYLLSFLFLWSGFVDKASATQRKREKNRGKIETKKTDSTPYQDFFRGKKGVTVNGLMTLHHMQGKIYVEFPLSLLEKDMMLSSSIKRISDNGEGVVGQFCDEPLHLKFTIVDSLLQAGVVTGNTLVNTSEDPNVVKAQAESALPGVFKSFKIETYTPDRDAVVVDMTHLFLEHSYHTNPFSAYAGNSMFGFVSRDHKFKEDRSSLKGIAAYANNLVVVCDQSYDVDQVFFGRFYIAKDLPVSVTIHKMLSLLPEEPMKPRLADSRVGVNYIVRSNFAGANEGLKTIYYMKRWRIEPSDESLYKQGQPVEPKKPIVFYLDTLMPTYWKKYVKAGVEEWNAAFEKIGFKNTIRVVDFPASDTLFDANNVNYSTIRYAPLWMAKPQMSMHIDPRSGEILNTSLYLHDNVLSTLWSYRLLSTIATDPSVRTLTPSEEQKGELLKLMVMQWVGRSLGLSDNARASSVYPVDSLRSASFTQKYGLSPSIMDAMVYNDIAQPEDVEKGALLLPRGIGAYDCYAIKCLYKPIYGVETPQQEHLVLDQWIRNVANDSTYRYGRRQFYYAEYDPRALSGDLGDDPIKALLYSTRNMKSFAEHFMTWLSGTEDKSVNFRNHLYDQFFFMYTDKLSYVKAYIGGIYLSEKRAGDQEPTYEPVPKAQQKKALACLIDLSKKSDWMGNAKMGASFELQDVLGKNMQEYIISSLLERIPAVSICHEVAGSEYTPDEFVADLYDAVWEPTLKNRAVNEQEMALQQSFVNSMIQSSSVTQPANQFYPKEENWQLTIAERLKITSLARIVHEESNHNAINETKSVYSPEKSGFTPPGRLTPHESFAPQLYFNLLLKTQNTLIQAISRTSGDTRLYYEWLQFKIKKALETRK